MLVFLDLVLSTLVISDENTFGSRYKNNLVVLNIFPFIFFIFAFFYQFCSVANLTLNTVPAAAGWYRPDVTSKEFFACQDEDCVGGTVDQQCAPGHGGILCAVCDEGFIRQNGVCTACDNSELVTDGTRGIIIAATVPPLLLFLVLLVYFCRVSNKVKENQSGHQAKDQKLTKAMKKQNKKKNKIKKKKKLKSTIKVLPAASNKVTQPVSKVAQATSKVAPAASKVNKVEEKKTEEKQRANSILAALAIQVWWYRTRGKEDQRMRARHHLAHTARKFQHILLNASSAGALAIDMVTEVVVSEVQGEVDGRVEAATAEATGATTGGEIEADMGQEPNMSTIGLGSLEADTTQRFRSLDHRMRILIGYAQITSALVFSFDIPWPPMTLTFLKFLTFVNFNFMDFFAPIDPCLLHTSFLKQATFHMAILPLCVFVVMSAALLAMRGDKSKVVWSKAKSTLVTIVFLLYPGIVTRVFMTFKCEKIGDQRYLVADYSVVCGEGEHATTSIVMLVFAGVYVIGIPLGTIVILFCNKKLLAVNDDASPALQKKSEDFVAVFGALYDAYEPRYWWFEAIIMMQKAMLTGGLVLVAPGSSAQVLVGLIIASGFLIVLMQTKPYEETEEDILQTIATVSTCATLLIGFTLKVDRGSSGEQAGEYDDAIIDIILILLFVGVGISGLYMSLKSLPCFAGEEKKREKKKGGEEGNSSSEFGDSNLPQVRPTGRRLKKRFSLQQQVRTVVTKDKVNKLQQSHAESHMAALDKIRKKQEHAGARVRQRLIERRKSKSGSERKSSSSSSGGGSSRKKDDDEKITPEERPSEQSLAMVEKMRSKLKKKIQTLQRLRRAFAKLDVGANGMLSKGEFETLVNMILKKKTVDKKISRLLWEAAWEQRKHGAEDELDSATLGHWLGLDDVPKV